MSNNMTCQCVRAVSSSLVIVLVGIHSPVQLAEIYDITELQQPDTASPAMTGFYTVTPDGETILEDPLESGFATSAGSDFDPERSSEEEAEPDTSGTQPEKVSSSQKKKIRAIYIRTKRKRPQRNLQDQFQCERHGFYYTNDGRCIAPAYGHLPLVPHPLPEHGMHPMMQD